MLATRAGWPGLGSIRKELISNTRSDLGVRNTIFAYRYLVCVDDSDVPQTCGCRPG